MSLTASSGRTWDEAGTPAAVRLVRRFEEAWRAADGTGVRPQPGDFLADAAGCPGARLALLRSEMALRWERGDKVDAAWFRTREPDLGDETFVALIYEEFCLREEADPDHPPDPDEYLNLYLDVAPALRRVLDIHRLVGSGTTTGLYEHEPGPPEIPFPTAGETIAGFRLVEELGRGAFARVFLAQERQLADRPVALKVSRTGSREPQTLARLQHTHIVPVHSYRTDPATGLHLLCMPFFGRVTLARLLDDPRVQVAHSGAELVAAVDRLGPSEPPPEGRSTGRAALSRRSYAQAIAWWGARMAEALGHAHDRGVLHRDVKPTNVLITADGMPMLLDFNLARQFVLDGPDDDRTAPGGTLDYMAPEHLDELADGRTDRVDARSDVYGLGVLLYEALAGSRPFPSPSQATSAAELLRRAADDRRQGPPRMRRARPEVPAALEAVVVHCLEPDPADRYGSAADLAADLQAVADDRPLRFAHEPWPHRVYRWARRNRRVLVIVLTVLAIVVGIAALMVQKKFEHDRNWIKAKRFYDEGSASEAAGDPSRAMVQYDSAVRLVDRPGRDELALDLAASTPSDAFTSLEELRQQARFRYRNAERTGKVRAAADAISVEAESLRFRLIGFGGNLEDASYALTAAFKPFHIFEPDDWLSRPDVALLDPARKARLKREVDELLFLWAVALDREGRHNPAHWHKALEVCNLALRSAEPDGPWEALRAWVVNRLNGAPTYTAVRLLPSETDSARICFQWGVLLVSQERKAEAAHWFKKAVRLEESNYLFHYFLALAFDQPPGVAVAALRHYDAAVALNPRSPWVRFSRARYYRLGQDFDLAREDLHRALSDYRALPLSDRDVSFEHQLRRELALLDSPSVP